MGTWVGTTCALALLLVGTVGPAAAFQAEVKRYHDLAVERAHYGGGRDNNFWGLRTPNRFYQDCFQSPGSIR